MVALLDVLVIATGVAGSADLRRLQTPEGAAAAFADAALHGDCDRFRELLSPSAVVEAAALGRQAQADDAARRGGAPLPLAEDAAVARACQALVRPDERVAASGVRVRSPTGTSAVVVLTVEGPGRAHHEVELAMVRSGRWRVGRGLAVAAATLGR